jgi:iron(III) transport system ATP-binding protein
MSRRAIRCIGLSKSYERIRAVDGLDLTLRQGEILALLGPSGCGKSTTLRLVAGFETPDRGRVEIGGRLVAGPGVCLPPEKRSVGMVFQSYALFPHLTVAQNVDYGVSRAKVRAGRVQEVLTLVGLSGLETRMPHELSGGQQQRVALARALAPRPEVLLLDEPFSNLDAGRRVQVRHEVREILKVSGTTALFVTHDQEEALAMGDRVGILHNGRLEQVGTPQEVFQAPATRFVAEFLGIPDFLPARVTQQGLETELGVAHPHAAVHLPPSTGVDVLVRPDDLTLRQDPEGGARIVRCIFRGMDYLYHVVLPSGREVRCLGPHTACYAPGTPVRVELTPGHTLTWFPNGRESNP